MSISSHQLIIYTDGSSRRNPGPGGFGAILMYGDKRKELSGGYRKTTNNRMELLGVITALESLTKKNIPLTIYTDSQVHCKSCSGKMARQMGADRLRRRQKKQISVDAFL